MCSYLFQKGIEEWLSSEVTRRRGAGYSWGSLSPSHRISNNKRRRDQTSAWPPSVWKRFVCCVLCTNSWSCHTTGWAKSHSYWKVGNSTQHHPGPRLLFSYWTRCIPPLFQPPRRLSTCSPAPDRQEAGWQSLTFFWFPRLLYSRYPPHISYVCYTKKTVVPENWNATLLEFDKTQDLDSKFSLWLWHRFTVWDVKNSLADKTQPWR